MKRIIYPVLNPIPIRKTNYSQTGMLWKVNNMEDKEITLRFLLRTVYRKGIMDSNEKKCDMSWEDTIIKDIKKLYETTNGKIQERKK